MDHYYQTFHDIVDGKTTIRKYCKENHIAHKTLKKKFIELDLDTNLIKKGRPIQSLDTTLIDEVMEYRSCYKCGYKRSKQVVERILKIKDPPIDISQHKVYSIFKDRSMFVSFRAKNKNSHKKRFVAKYINQIWHTDLHYYNKITINQKEIQQYLLAFIDDRSRFIIYWTLIQDKSADTVSLHLRNLLARHCPPSRLVSDNGSEFIASSVQEILQHHDIIQYRIKPYTPQENGKMERWWRTIEDSIYNKEDLGPGIFQYNYIWYHSSLKHLYGRNTTPYESYSNDIKWNTSYLDELTYYTTK